MFWEMRDAVSEWASYNICFSKAALFISGLVFSHAFVEDAFFNVLISYVTSSWESYQLPKAAAIVNAQQGVSILLPLVLAYVADEWLGRFMVVGYTTAAFITGLVILYFHSGSGVIFYLALLLVTLGKGGRDPTLQAFLRDQFSPNQNSEMAEARQQFWWRSAFFLGAVVATIISSFLSKEKIVMVSSIITGAASLVFLLGIRCYNKEPPRSNFRLPMNNLRNLLRLVPLWITFLVYCLVESTGTTFFLEQSDNLKDRIGNGKGFKIPIAFFPALSSLTKFLTCQLVDFIIATKFWKESQRKLAFLVRIAVGMLVSFMCCITAREVEVRRLKLIKEYGIIDYKEDEWIPMNIMSLAPQFVLLGIMGGLVEQGMERSFYNLVPKSMRMYELPFNKIVMGMGKILSIGTIFVFRGWFGDTSATSHLDRYYMMLAITSTGSLAFFTLAAYACYWNYMAPEECLAQGTESFQTENEATTSGGIEIVLHRSRSEPFGSRVCAKKTCVAQESSTQSLLKGYFFSQGDSTAARPSRWNSFGSRSHGNTRSFSM
ncbi:hypothetical protein GQ457_03G031790 [Hibiscus cannabinus]